MPDSVEDCCCVACGVVLAALVAAAFPVTQISLGAVYLNECPAGPAVPIYELVGGVVTLLVMGMAVTQKLVPPGLLLKIWLCCIMCISLFGFAWFIYGSYHIYVIYQPSFTKPAIGPKGMNDSAYGSPDPSVEPSNQSLPLSNQTWAMDHNLTSANLTEPVPLGNSSSEMKVLQAQQGAPAVAEAPYCNRTLYLFAFWTTTLVYGLAGLGLAMSACIYGCMLLLALLTSCFS